MLLTIFTPTYNRRERLKTAYDSLCRQTMKDFIWLIVDDGSTDGTYLEVEQWIKENKLSIQFIREENHGKAYAHNTGVFACETEAFTCLDSDDFLLENAVESILSIWDEKCSQENIAGMVSPKCMKDSEPFSDQIPQYGTLQELYDCYGFKGETLLVFKTRVLKEYPFPVIKNERFMKEAIVYLKIDSRYRYYYYNHFQCCAEYLGDGLTALGKKRDTANPNSMLLYFKVGATYRRIRFLRWKSAGCYYAWKSHFNLDDQAEGVLPIDSVIIGRLLSVHYKKLFYKQY